MVGAELFLTAWSLAWHPEALVATGRIPRWLSQEHSPEERSGNLLLAPAFGDAPTPADDPDQPEPRPHESPESPGACETTEGHDSAVMITDFSDRDAALSEMRVAFNDSRHVADHVADHFAAFGLAYLLLKQLTDHRGYYSNLDDTVVESAIVSAARQAVEQAAVDWDDVLRPAYDALGEARDYFYPVPSYFVELVLVAEVNFGAPLRQRIDEGTPGNYVVSPNLVDAMALHEPETVEQLQAAVAGGAASIVVADDDAEITSGSLESLREYWLRSRQRLARYFGDAMLVYGGQQLVRLPYAATILREVGFEYAVLAPLTGQPLPSSTQCKVDWQGIGGPGLEAIRLDPHDAGQSDFLLDLAGELSRSMDRDHVATMLFAAWAGHACRDFARLRRAAALTESLGVFVTLSEYFSTTTSLGIEYRPDAIRLYQTLSEPHLPTSDENVLESLSRGLAEIAGGRPLQDGESAAEVIGRQAAPDLATDAATAGCLVMNPLAASRTISFHLEQHRPSGSTEVALESPHDLWGPPPTHFARDVPGCGFAWVPAQCPEPPPVPLAEGCVLRNELFEVLIDEQSGGIRSVHRWGKRGNLLSQQLAFRLAAGEAAEPPRYSQMIADCVEVSAATSACGEITSTGRLLEPTGRTIASYRQSVRLCRRSNRLLFGFQIQQEVDEFASQSPVAVVVRWALPREPDAVWCGLQDALIPTTLDQLTAAEFVTAGWTDLRTTFFPSAPLHHVRSGPNTIDSWIARKAREPRIIWRMAVAFDEQAIADTAVWLAQGEATPRYASTVSEPSQSAGWLARIAPRNVRLTAICPVANEKALRLRIQETAGQATDCELELFRPLVAARRVDLQGTLRCEIPLAESGVMISLRGYEWVEIELRWE